ncbi:MAG TPA: type VI secretion system baseplate subunit TssE [Bryobacteraceae bacterium]|jgi:type VI secretion system protein ImpF|nr:type VI secretion system baseplate subunit TssE [Bryobacteraceae bacterium]
MPRSDADQPVTQPLIDRLIDREKDRDRDRSIPPSATADPYRTRSASIRGLKAALRRDLEWLLNTRRNPFAAPDSMPELSQSLYNYGLPDFSAMSADAPKDRQRLVIEIERTVALFEPRLRNIRVVLVEGSSAGARTLRFHIEGSLQMDPSPEHISFDGELQLASGEYQIRGER